MTETLQKAEELLAGPRRPRAESAEGSFNALHKRVISFNIGDFKADPRPLQNGKRLYKHPRTANFDGGHELISPLDNALSDLLNSMNIAVAKPLKVLYWESHKASITDMESVFAMRVRGVASHDHGRGVQDLLESRSHGCAEAVHHYDLARTYRSRVCEKWGDERVNWAQNTRKFEQKPDRSLQRTLSRLLV